MRALTLLARRRGPHVFLFALLAWLGAEAGAAAGPPGPRDAGTIASAKSALLGPIVDVADAGLATQPLPLVQETATNVRVCEDLPLPAPQPIGSVPMIDPWAE